MIKFFRHIRQQLLNQNKFSKYMLYAGGEIVLVVVGILIALQVNNWNINQTRRKEEVKYLANIKLDLQKDTARLAYLIEFRKARLIGDRALIEHINNRTTGNISELTKNVVNSLMEESFLPNNNTYSELSNSGNLNLISNDSIKVLLLELEELYKLNQQAIDHETFDYREYISKPIVKHTKIDQLFPVYFDLQTIEEQHLTKENFTPLLENMEYKNGLYIITITSEAFIELYQQVSSKSTTIIELIEKDLNK